MIDHCLKCESKALDHIEPRQGEHEYCCRSCGKVSRTIEVPEEHLRNLTLAALGKPLPA